MRLLLLMVVLSLPASAQRKTIPEFVAGDQCLFCHRNDIGPIWQKDAHNLTTRPKDGSEELYILGAGKTTRELKKTGYGRFAIHDPGGAWNADKFANRCAGCHTTAVDAETKAFAYYGIDCYACHGAVNLEHTNDTSLIILSKKRRRDPKMIASICGSCHLRGGHSKAKGFPYAYHFVPGDDLFTGYEVDLNNLNTSDRHIYRNIRDVLQHNSDVTCLSCHALHQNSTRKHRLVLTSPACLDCHNETGPKKDVKPYVQSSETCEIR
jgi:hypothetical protein